MYRILPSWDNKYGKCENLCPLHKAWLTLCQFLRSYNHSDIFIVIIYTEFYYRTQNVENRTTFFYAIK